MKLRLVLTFVAFALFGIATTAHAQDKAVIDQGMKVYATLNCKLCHSIDGVGNAKGPLDGVGTKLTAADIRAWLTDPKGMTTKTKATRVPAMTVKAGVAKADVDALVAYMVSLKKK